MENWLGLAGKTCVVTGAAGGIGKAIAAELLAQGARVALLDRDLEASTAAAKDIDPEGSRTLALACDVSTPGAVQAAETSVTHAFGPCDVLVNNAGILRPGPLETLGLADWNALIEVNLTGYLRCSQVFGRAMLDRSAGALVHVASISASQPQPFSGAYSPSKAAVAMLSRQLACEWGPRGVRSNVVSPGMIETPLSAEFYRAPGVRERRAAVIPTRRVGQPEDIAQVAAFLASPRAGYVNGQELLVDGGYSQSLMGLVPRPGYEEAST